MSVFVAQVAARGLYGPRPEAFRSISSPGDPASRCHHERRSARDLQFPSTHFAGGCPTFRSLKGGFFLTCLVSSEAAANVGFCSSGRGTRFVRAET
jgi:hypothetical protein